MKHDWPLFQSILILGLNIPFRICSHFFSLSFFHSAIFSSWKKCDRPKAVMHRKFLKFGVCICSTTDASRSHTAICISIRCGCCIYRRRNYIVSLVRRFTHDVLRKCAAPELHTYALCVCYVKNGIRVEGIHRKQYAYHTQNKNSHIASICKTERTRNIHKSPFRWRKSNV